MHSFKSSYTFVFSSTVLPLVVSELQPWKWQNKQHAAMELMTAQDVPHTLTFELIMHLSYASAITAAKGNAAMPATLFWWFLEPNLGSRYREGGFGRCLQTTTVPYQCHYCLDVNEAADSLLPCTKLATHFCSCWLFQAFKGHT